MANNNTNYHFGFTYWNLENLKLTAYVRKAKRNWHK